jgi:hypothetical protein
MKAWQTEIFVGLYVVALVLTWATLFAIERFGATDFKAWAPFIQAVLSALAIFSAWALQGLKRESDRRQEVEDTKVAIVAVTHILEKNAARVSEICANGRLTKTVITKLKPGIDDYLVILRSQKLAHLPSFEATDALLALINQFLNVQGSLTEYGESLTGNDAAPRSLLLTRYQRVFPARSRLLKELSVKDPEGRKEPGEIEALLTRPIE